MAKDSEPWTKPNPRKAAGKPSKPLSPSQKASAKVSAKRAGRKTPSLVDNMHAASKMKKSGAPTTKGTTEKATKTATKRATKTALVKSAGRTAAKKSASKAQAKGAKASSVAHTTRAAKTKDPKGGLTAAGRAAFAKSQGSHLKPGVKKPISAMTPMEMKRKGSWAVRFFARDPLPPLIDKAGHPTRLALSAHAWGEPVPKTEVAARKIAAKGERLLARYAKAKGKS